MKPATVRAENAQSPNLVKVKGGSIRSKIAFVEATAGPAKAAELRRYLESLGHPQILEANWYPYALFDQTLRWLADHCFGGDLERLVEVGEHSAQLALTTTYDIYVRNCDLLGLYQRLTRVHRRYYDRGDLHVMASSESGAHLRLEGALHQEPDARVAAGFYVGAARLLGREEVQVRIDLARDHVDFFLTWR